MHSRRLQEELDAAIAEGWQIEQETPDRVVLVRHTYGSVGAHLLLAVLTAWWSFGVFNLLYGGYSYLNESERRVLRAPTGRTCPECGTTAQHRAEYCRKCGTRLGGATTGEESGGEPIATCSKCDTVVAGGSGYCVNCGAELAEAAD